MINALRLYITCAFILLLTLPAYPQFHGLKNYNVKDGLPSSEVYGIMQDSKGYIWTIGDMGASRFDGYTFTNFSTGNGLPENTILGIYEDRKGRIWLHTLSGRLAYVINDSVFVPSCNPRLKEILEHRFTTSIYVDEKDTIWLGTTGNYMLKIGPQWTTADLKKISTGKGNYLFTIGREGLIYGGSTTGVFTITVYNSSLDVLYTIAPGIPQKAGAVRSCFIRSNDGTYIASLQEILIRFNKTGILDKETESSAIICLHENKDGTIMTGTYNGITIRKGNDLAALRNIPQLSNKVITGTCVDRENGFWFTTEGHGMYYIPHPDIKYYTPLNGLSENKISCMRAHGDMVMTGHLDGSISLLGKDSVWSLSLLDDEGKLTSSSRITGIFSMNGNVYATHHSGLYRFENDKLQHISELATTGIKKALVSRDGNLWILNFRQLLLFDPGNYREPMMSLDIPGRTDNLFEDSNGTLWLCAIDGVYTYDGTEVIYQGAASKLLSHRAVEIAEAPDKSIWIATRGGGVIIKKGNIVKQLTSKDGLSGDMCRSLLADRNIMWVGTNKGLSKITPGANGNYIIENYYTGSGLLTNEVNSIIEHNGKLLLANNNGITIFDPANVKNNTYPPPVYISQLFVNNKAYDKNDPGELEYEQDYITIDFMGLAFKDAGNVEYKYKMSGIDPGWIHTRYTTVKYNSVPPGTYTFAVYAKNNDGYWSSKPATLTFTILPAWWQTWIFRAGTGATLLILIALIFKVRLNRIRKREQEKAMMRFELAEAELKALRSQMNPHFIFNAINSVQYFITSNDPDSSQKYLSKFAKLIRYVVDNSKPSAIPLRTELDALRLYLELESLRFDNAFEYEIKVQPGIDIDYIQVPSMLIQPYIENAIWHGVMHKKGKGRIELLLEMQGEVLKCRIKDDGIGRKRSNEIKLASGKDLHQSIGMWNTRERLDIINRVNNTNLNVVITDLENTHGEAAGTLVELNIPAL